MDQKGEQQPECVTDQEKVQQSHDNVEEELDSEKMKEKAKGFLKHLKYISDCEGKPQFNIKNKKQIEKEMQEFCRNIRAM